MLMIGVLLRLHIAIEQLPSDRYCSHELDASNYPYFSRGRLVIKRQSSKYHLVQRHLLHGTYNGRLSTVQKPIEAGHDILHNIAS